jgi:hypothetical protein
MLPQVGVHVSDVIAWLWVQHGLRVRRHRLRHAVKTGVIPKPYTTASGDCGWKESDLGVLAAYFRNPRRQGRPKAQW